LNTEETCTVDFRAGENVRDRHGAIGKMGRNVPAVTEAWKRHDLGYRIARGKDAL
jgi:hypothetical protein